MSRFDPSVVVEEPTRQAANNESFVRRGRVVAARRKRGDPAVAILAGSHVLLVVDVDTAAEVAEAIAEAVREAVAADVR